MSRLLIVLLIFLLGCESGYQRTSDSVEIQDRGDGWMYFCNTTRGVDISRFRIKNKLTSSDDFDVEQLDGGKKP